MSLLSCCSDRRKYTQLPSGARSTKPTSASSFRCRLMRGWLWPRTRVRSLTLSSPCASSASTRSRVGSAMALSTLTHICWDSRGWDKGQGFPTAPSAQAYKDILICQERRWSRWEAPVDRGRADGATATRPCAHPALWWRDGGSGAPQAPRPDHLPPRDFVKGDQLG